MAHPFQTFPMVNQDLVVQMAPGYLSETMALLRAHYPLETLIANARLVPSQLTAEGLENMQRQAHHISYTFFYSRLRAPAFLRLYLTEVPTHQDIMGRFYAAVASDSFEIADLYEAVLHALTVCDALAYWTTAPTHILH